MTSTGNHKETARTMNDDVEIKSDNNNNNNNKPCLYLVITNISKKANVRTLIQVGAAFDCKGIFVIGQKKFDWTNDIPKQLHESISTGMFKIQHFDKWDDYVKYIHEHNIRLIGVEIHENSKSIEDILLNNSNNKQQQHNNNNIALLMGNEGTGIHKKHMKDCNDFVRISQYGSGTASLNVYVAASIILHRFYTYYK